MIRTLIGLAACAFAYCVGMGLLPPASRVPLIEDPNIFDRYLRIERQPTWLEVARLLARGKTNRDIGASLGISPGTVKIHVEHIYEKLGVHSRAGIAIWLMENDLL